jgi:hypothetical protein
MENIGAKCQPPVGFRGRAPVRRGIGGRIAAALAAIVVALGLGGVPAAAADGALLQPKYHLPAASFAYVGDAAKPATWKLPFRHADGSVDRRRLPLAVEAMVETYRGRRARIPGSERHEVLEKLAQAADEIGKLPPRAAHPTPLYRKLAAALGHDRR